MISCSTTATVMVIMDALASIQCVMHYWECPLTTWTEPFCNLSSCSAQTISPAQLLIPSSLHICNKFQTKAIVLTLLYFFFLFHCFKLVSATSNSDLNHGDCNLMLRLLCLFFSIFLLIIFFFLWFNITWRFMVKGYGNMLSLGVWVLKLAAS